jgi:hypothetical protein
MIYTTLDTFYLSHEQILDSPSRRDGVDENVESLLRVYGCELIQECGILLKLYFISVPFSFSKPCFYTLVQVFGTVLFLSSVWLSNDTYHHHGRNVDVRDFVAVCFSLFRIGVFKGILCAILLCSFCKFIVSRISRVLIVPVFFLDAM